MECQICSKKLSSAKALGGHMKSHYAFFPLPPKATQVEKHNEPVNGSTSSLISSNEKGGSSGDKSLSCATYGLRENPKKSLRLVDTHFDNEGSLVETKKSEPRLATQGRCKRVSVENGQEGITKECLQESNLEKQSGFESVEDVAWCLVMLSRDVWISPDSEIMHRKDYTCETCKKIFKSPQGLGNHKASHDRKAKNSVDDVCEDNVRKQKNFVEEQVYKCSFCDQIFNSAQALAEHKRSHFSKVGESSTSINISDNSREFYIDLNMPPRTEDEEKK
ncbi:hypothetical protein CDL12_20271 [Handroanthus impetiginosus]|uniref:C2H2-type domain-containing protein n=1 Tax=Handroanthus impetiginosus TaxID=429701 RepID=A0A2G9GPM0_9LAMI|nr:hypothetical protein CDL12_20271 [Handroanthus impetiginosus]